MCSHLQVATMVLGTWAANSRYLDPLKIYLPAPIFGFVKALDSLHSRLGRERLRRRDPIVGLCLARLRGLRVLSMEYDC